jgi:hypothetical protein
VTTVSSEVTVLQLVRNFLAYYRNRKSVTVLMCIRHRTISWARLVHNQATYFFSKPQLVLPVHLCLGVQAFSSLQGYRLKFPNLCSSFSCCCISQSLWWLNHCAIILRFLLFLFSLVLLFFLTLLSRHICVQLFHNAYFIQSWINSSQPITSSC